MNSPRMAPVRAPSPAPSENDVDILDDLLPAESAEPPRKRAKIKALDVDDILNTEGRGPAEGGDDAEDSDAAFISSLQASSFRKASNLKGNSVKKGGGFQAMGEAKPGTFISGLLPSKEPLF